MSKVTELDPHTDTFSAWYKVLHKSPQAEFALQLNAATVETLRNRVAARNRASWISPQNRGFWRAACNGLGILSYLTALTLLWLRPQTYPSYAEGQTGLAGVVLVLTMMTWMVTSVIWYYSRLLMDAVSEPVTQLSRALRPLSELPAECARAAESCEESPRCANYLSQVLSTGRELYAFDLPILDELRSAEEKTRKQATHQENLARLYGDTLNVKS